ncbi:PX domain-containing protein [Phthorimaea operculella]|nr:PX domain-containing protein [Phthorimaea operculella]
MAIFEKSSQSRTILDDTEKLICTVENAQNINKHTEYILRVQRGPNKENRWTVSRRYSDFAALHVSLQPANIDLPLPPKKLIGNMQPSFIAERQIALQAYINEVLKHQVLALTLQVRSFLDPNNYSLTLAEQALQTVSIALRGDGRYELKGPLPQIGWRIHKHYFMVIDTDSRTNCMLSWQNYGPDRYLSDKDLQAAFRSIQNLSHPYIDPVLTVHSLETGAYVVRRIHEKGTIRDMLYGTEYTKNYLSKYGNPKVRKPFTTGQIAHYGHQILEALKFLHEKGIPHGHIHPGNIAIENQKVQLLDIENFLMGAPCLHRPHILELRKSTQAESIDVYCFARTIYEMAFAKPLEQHYCDDFPEDFSEGLESIFRLCLSSMACKHAVLTLDMLFYHPFFTGSPLISITPREGGDGRAHLKFPLQLKAALRDAVAAYETRIKSEQKLATLREAVVAYETRIKNYQKLVRSTKREVRIQEILGSEEELKKQKRRAKKRESVWKSTSSLAPSHSASTASSPTPPVARKFIFLQPSQLGSAQHVLAPSHSASTASSPTPPVARKFIFLQPSQLGSAQHVLAPSHSASTASSPTQPVARKFIFLQPSQLGSAQHVLAPSHSASTASSPTPPVARKFVFLQPSQLGSAQHVVAPSHSASTASSPTPPVARKFIFLQPSQLGSAQHVVAPSHSASTASSPTPPVARKFIFLQPSQLGSAQHVVAPSHSASTASSPTPPVARKFIFLQPSQLGSAQHVVAPSHSASTASSPTPPVARKFIFLHPSQLGSAQHVVAPSHSASTASSPTPPVAPADTNGNGTLSSCTASPTDAVSPLSARSPTDSRSALLDAICSFDKSRLTRRSDPKS